jgi:hypothetical protein
LLLVLLLKKRKKKQETSSTARGEAPEDGGDETGGETWAFVRKSGGNHKVRVGSGEREDAQAAHTRIHAKRA